MSRGERKAMVLRDRPDLSLSRQCRLLSISRSSFYYAPSRLVNPLNVSVHQHGNLMPTSSGISR